MRWVDVLDMQWYVCNVDLFNSAAYSGHQLILSDQKILNHLFLSQLGEKKEKRKISKVELLPDAILAIIFQHLAELENATLCLVVPLVSQAFKRVCKECVTTNVVKPSLWTRSTSTSAAHGISNTVCNNKPEPTLYSEYIYFVEAFFFGKLWLFLRGAPLPLLSYRWPSILSIKLCFGIRFWHYCNPK